MGNALGQQFRGNQSANRMALATLLAQSTGESSFGSIARHDPNIEIGHTRDSLLMGDYYDGDVGALIGDLIGDDDDMGDYDDMGEIGRRRRHKLKKLNRLAKKQGLVVLPREAAMQAAAEAQAAQHMANKAAATEAAYSGVPQTARGNLAISGQRELILPFATLSLAAPLASTGVITANVQRDIQLRRFLMTGTDAVAFTDASATIGVSLIKIGADVVFNANGVVPLAAFAALAVGVNLMCQPATTGTLVEITLVRTVATVNAALIMASGYGFSAGSR